MIPFYQEIAIISPEIERLKQNIDKTINDATALLEKGKQHLQANNYTYISRELPLVSLSPNLSQFVLYCIAIDKKKGELEKLKTALASENIDNLETKQEMDLSEELSEPETPKMREAASVIDTKEDEDLEEDWAAEADAEAEEKIAKGIPLFNAEEFGKLVQLDIKNPKTESRSFDMQYQALANSIERFAQEFEENQKKSTETILDQKTAKQILGQTEDLRPSANTDTLNKTLGTLNQNFDKLEHSKQTEQPLKPTSPAMKYLQKRQAEAPEQKPVSNTPEPSSNSSSKKRHRSRL